MPRYVCIHGHFYQPPRENPWLESIEPQDSAYPFRDWNERIDAECYAPNAEARILDDAGRVLRLVNNYGSISFNFGPTLLSWLELHDAETYAAILAAEHQSRERFSGHGSALAQVYGHAILPLTNPRDRRTQVLWGARDFAHRFGRDADGMWLPETAVDVASLEELASAGMRFTILSPSQAAAVRPIGETEWREVRDGSIDCGMPYRVFLPSGRTIDLFFYDGAISQVVAFERLLESGAELARRLSSAAAEDTRRPHLVCIATDGETYGHHHRHGEMALAAAIDRLDGAKSVRLTNFGEHLERHPPTLEVQIREKTAWSCAHGVERWRADCGCRLGEPGWTQAWRAPLREALDWLRDRLAPWFERQAGALLADPWVARDDYIDVLLDPSHGNVAGFLERQARRPLDPADRTRAILLLETQRQALLMYTSCGWFFDELSGIETVQILRYAARALQLVEELSGERWEDAFVRRLERAPGNRPELADGRAVWLREVLPGRLDRAEVAANVAAGLLANSDRPLDVAPGYAAVNLDLWRTETRRARLLVGRWRIVSRRTAESEEFDVAYLHSFADHDVRGAVRAAAVGDPCRRIADELADAVARGQAREAHARLERDFGGRSVNWRSLLSEPRRRVLETLLERAVAEGMSDDWRLEQLLDEAAELGVRPSAPVATSAAGRLLDRLRRTPDDPLALERLVRATRWLLPAPPGLDRRRLENVYHRLVIARSTPQGVAAERGDADAGRWMAALAGLGRALDLPEIDPCIE